MKKGAAKLLSSKVPSYRRHSHTLTGGIDVPKGRVTTYPIRCKRCGICVALCPEDNLAIVEGDLVAYDHRAHGERVV